MANIPSVEDMQIITVKSFDEDKFEQYIVAVVNKIKEAAKQGLFSVDIKYTDVTNNSIYYCGYYGESILNKYGFALFDCIIASFVKEGYKCQPCNTVNNSYFTLSWYLGDNE